MTPALASPPRHQLLSDLGDFLCSARPGLGGLDLAARHIAADADPLRCLLEQLRESAELVDAVCRRSYWHPNGFAKLVLHDSDSPEFRLRLHVWPASSGLRLGESNPHSHRWDFASTLVVGDGLHIDEYAECDGRAMPYVRYRYGSSRDGSSALSPHGEAHLDRMRSFVVGLGAAYPCDTRVVHTVAPVGSRLAATAVVQGAPRSATAVVYRHPGQSADQRNGELTADDLERITGEVLVAMRQRDLAL